MFVEGVLWIVRTGSPWRDLPEVFGEWNSVFRRFSRWSAQRCLAAHLRGAVGRSRFRIPDYRFDDRARPPARQRRKRGAQNQAIGRSRGGLTHQNPSRRARPGLPGALHPHSRPGRRCTASRPASRWRAGRGGDRRYRLRCRPFRQRDRRQKAQAVIPNNPSRTRKHPLDAHLYAQRHLVECCFSKLKQFGVATVRKDRRKLPRRRNYRSSSALAKINVHTT